MIFSLSICHASVGWHPVQKAFRQLCVCMTVLLLLFSSPVFALSPDQAPKFEDYSVAALPPDAEAVPVDVNLQSHPKASEHRVQLRHAMRGGPNFAEKYILSSWNCGMDCLTVAIIDTSSGAVYFPPEFAYLGIGLVRYEVDSAAAALVRPNALTYQRDSNLIIVSGAPSPDGSSRIEGGVYYYVWENNNLKLIAQANAKTSPPQL